MANMVARKGVNMRNVGIKELKDQASSIVSAGEAVIIERYGRPVGMYVPLEQVGAGDKARAYQLASDIQRLMREIAERSGLTPDELADEVERLAVDEDRRAS